MRRTTGRPVIVIPADNVAPTSSAQSKPPGYMGPKNRQAYREEQGLLPTNLNRQLDEVSRDTAARGTVEHDVTGAVPRAQSQTTPRTPRERKHSTDLLHETSQPAVNSARKAKVDNPTPDAAPARPAEPAHDERSRQMADKGAALLAWAQFRTDELAKTPRSEGQALLALASVEPNSIKDVVALKALVAKANELAAPSHPQHRPKGTLDILFETYESHQLPVVLRNDVFRTATTVLALLEDGNTKEQVDRTCFMAMLRDTFAQIGASTVGYAASFGAYNTILLDLIKDGRTSAVQASVPPLAMTALTLFAQRLLRMGEMYPGWTSPVEADKKGATQPAIKTDPGWAKVATQYWPFIAHLLYASVALPDPSTVAGQERIDRNLCRTRFRRDWGFLPTQLVALHRMFKLDREHVWLNASTPLQRQAMAGAIQELDSKLNALVAAIKYVTVRPVAGLTGALTGVDVHTFFDELWASHVAGPSADAKHAIPLPKVQVAPLMDNLTNTLARASMLYGSMWVFGAMRAYANENPDRSDLINVANDFGLIGGWGVEMAASEKLVANDPDIAQENASRTARQRARLARLGWTPPPPESVAPVQTTGVRWRVSTPPPLVDIAMDVRPASSSSSSSTASTNGDSQRAAPTARTGDSHEH